MGSAPTPRAEWQIPAQLAYNAINGLNGGEWVAVAAFARAPDDKAWFTKNTAEYPEGWPWPFEPPCAQKPSTCENVQVETALYFCSRRFIAGLRQWIICTGPRDAMKRFADTLISYRDSGRYGPTIVDTLHLTAKAAGLSFAIRETAQPYPVPTNNAQDLKCPECGHEHDFEVDTTAVIYVSKNGDEDIKSYYGGYDGWLDEPYAANYCKCMKCEHDGTVFEFTADARAAAEKGKTE